MIAQTYSKDDAGIKGVIINDQINQKEELLIHYNTEIGVDGDAMVKKLIPKTEIISPSFYYLKIRLAVPVS